MGYFQVFFEILRASLVVARMAAFLRAEDIQRALHTFRSGKKPSCFPLRLADERDCTKILVCYLSFDSATESLILARKEGHVFK